MVSVIVVNWNSSHQLRDCLASVLASSDGLVRQVIVVDNASSDGSERCATSMPDVRLIRAGTNLGFAKACNIGAATADSEYLLFLNPDARIYPRCLEKVVQFMGRSENRGVGICGVQLMDSHGKVARTCSRFPSATRIVAQSAGLYRVIPSLGLLMHDWDHASTRHVDQVMGAFFLIRRSLYQQLGGFDERFFMYFEEVDLSFRARKLGWLSVYFAESQTFHAGGGTSKQVKAMRLFYSLRSRVLYAFKHFNVMATLVVLIATLGLEPISRSALAIQRRSWTSLVETWRAYGMLARWLASWIVKGAAR